MREAGVNHACASAPAMLQRYVPALACLALLACAQEGVDTDPPERDPAVARALADQLMVDPDLVGQNEAPAALTADTNFSIPLEIATPEAVRDAQREAEELVGRAGAELPRPEPLSRGSPSPLARLSDQAARMPDAAECLGLATQSAVWAARLPAAMPVYPRGATQQALGSDAPRCGLRVVRFTSPVPVKDITRFYFAKARAAGLAPRYSAAGDEHRIEGRRGTMRFSMHLRPHLSGSNEVDLVVVTG